MAKKLSHSKAKEILHHGEIHGHPLTDKQRKFFGAVSSGYIKAQKGINQPIYTSNPRDPRIKAYQDSLKLYSNFYKKELENFASGAVKVGPLGKVYPEYIYPGETTSEEVAPNVYKPKYKVNPDYHPTIKPIGIQEYEPKSDPNIVENILLDDEARKKYSSKLSYSTLNVFKKPVQPVIYKKEHPPLPPIRPEFNQPDISEPGVPMFRLTEPVAAQLPESKPTKYTFTYPTGPYNEQKTVYFPDKTSWRNFISTMKGVSSQEGEGYGSATGYLQEGGSVEGRMGGLTDKGFNFNPAWGGAWENGGSIEKAQFGKTKKVKDPDQKWIQAAATQHQKCGLGTEDPACKTEPQLVFPGMPTYENMSNPLNLWNWPESKKEQKAFMSDVDARLNALSQQYPDLTKETLVAAMRDSARTNQLLNNPNYAHLFDKSGKLVDSTVPVEPFIRYWKQAYPEKTKITVPEMLQNLGQNIINYPNLINTGYRRFQDGGGILQPPMAGANQTVPMGQNGLTFLEPNSMKLPRVGQSSELAMSIGGEEGEPAYLIPTMKYGRMQVNPLFEFKRTGENLGGPFKTWQEADEWEKTVRHPYVEKGESIPTPYKRWGQFAMGGSLPGMTGSIYARTVGAAPSEGKYAKKTLPSAQNGKEMQYYQQGLDFQPKTISRNGGWLDKYDEAQDGKVILSPMQQAQLSGIQGDIKSTFNVPTAEQLKQQKDIEEYNKQVEARNKFYAGREYVGPAKQRTQAEEKQAQEFRRKKNEEYIADKPHLKLDNQGNIINTNPELTLEGRPISGTPTAQWNKFLGSFETPLAIESAISLAPLVGRGLAAGARTAGEYLTTQTPLRSAYKYNPFAFKGDPNAYYRKIGDEAGLLDLQTSGIVRSKPIPEELLAEYKRRNISTYPDPYFAIGKPAETYQGKYMVEYKGDVPFNRFRVLDEVATPKGQIELYDPGLKIYQKDWLRGYKEVPKPKTTEELIDLYRIQNKGAKPFAQLLAEGQVTNPILSTEDVAARKAAQEKYFGQWFTSNKADLDWYLRDREFIDPEIIHLRVPKSKLSEFQQFEKTMSRAPEREYVVPFEQQALYKQVPKSTEMAEFPVQVTGPGRTIQTIKQMPTWKDSWEAVSRKNNPNFDPDRYVNWFKKKDGGIVKDDMGYWNPQNWGKTVEINSNDITMEGVNQPLLGVSDEGDVKYMEPGKNYKFKGKKVTEYPIGAQGVSVNKADEYPLHKLDDLLNFGNYNKKAKSGGWLDKYK